MTSLSVSGTGFNISGLSAGNVIGASAPNNARGGTVTFSSPGNILNGAKLTGTAQVALTNSLADGSALTGASTGDVGTYSYTLAGTVSGNVAGYGIAQTASLSAGDSLAGLASSTLHNTASILSGTASASGTLSETWRAKTGSETRVHSDVVAVDTSQVQSGSYVLQMSYDEADLGGKSESRLAWALSTAAPGPKPPPAPSTPEPTPGKPPPWATGGSTPPATPSGRS